MSTLYDALKKAEAENKKAAGIDVKSPEGGKAMSKEGMSDNVKTVILLIAVIIVFGIAFYRFNAAKTPPVVQKSAITQAVVPVEPPPVRASAAGTAVVLAQKPQREPGTYELDGVIDAGSNSMAIINGKLLKIEGTIDNLVLKKISPKEVELFNTQENKTVILKIN